MVRFCHRLGDSWSDLADVLDVPTHDRARFTTGDEARALWEWLERRNRLAQLPMALVAVRRRDLAGLFVEGGRRPSRAPNRYRST